MEKLIRLGRWLYPALVEARQVATPWLMRVLSIIYISLGVVLVTKISNFYKLQGLAVAILFSSNITLTALFCTYIFDADADCLVLLLACFAVYAFETLPKKINVVVSVISLTLYLALYQAYICVALGVFIAVIIIKARDANCWNDVLRVFIIGIKELCVVIWQHYYMYQ